MRGVAAGVPRTTGQAVQHVGPVAPNMWMAAWMRVATKRIHSALPMLSTSGGQLETEGVRTHR